MRRNASLLNEYADSRNLRSIMIYPTFEDAVGSIRRVLIRLDAHQTENMSAPTFQLCLLNFKRFGRHQLYLNHAVSAVTADNLSLSHIS